MQSGAVPVHYGTNRLRMDHPLDQLKKMERFQNDPETLRRFGEIKRRNKQVLADYIEKVEGVTVNPDFLFDVQPSGFMSIRGSY